MNDVIAWGGIVTAMDQILKFFFCGGTIGLKRGLSGLAQ